MNWKPLAFLAVVVIGAFVVVKYLAGKAGGILDVKDVRVGLYNFLTVGVMAALFILLLKYATARFPVPGLTEAAHAI